MSLSAMVASRFSAVISRVAMRRIYPRGFVYVPSATHGRSAAARRYDGRIGSADPRVVIVGGGAAGFFAAVACKEANPAARVTVLEGSASPLAKVRVSGGGRCNVTHDQADPALLVGYYPRGGRALRGPFTRFGHETMAWFAARGVPLKTGPTAACSPRPTTRGP